MYDKLKTFIKENKQAFDSFEPSKDLWTKIDTNMSTTQNFPIKSKWVSWLKYIGLSSVIVVAITYSYHQLNKNETSNILSSTRSTSPALIKTVETEPTENNSQELLTNTDNTKETSLTKKTVATTIQKQNAALPAISITDSIPNTLEQIVAYSDPRINSSATSTIQHKSRFKQVKNTGNNATKMIVDTLFSGIKRLEIDASFFDIHIQSNQRDKVIFHGELNTKMRGLFLSKMDCKIKYEQKDSVLHVFIETKGNLAVGFGSIEQTAVLNFDVPPTIDVVANNSSGDIKLEGLKGGNCIVTAQYGDVKIENANTNLNLQIGSGDLILNNMKGDITALSSYGNQTLENINGNINLKNKSGDISIINLKGDIKLESGYGAQRLGGINGKIVSKNSSGDISIKKSTGDINTVLNFGNLNIENNAGNITVKNNSGDIDVKTSNGDINIAAIYGDIKIMESKGDLSIVSKSGDITGKNIEVKEKSDLSASYGNIKMDFKNDFNDLSFDLKAELGYLNVNKNGQKIKGDNGVLFLNQGKIHIKGYTASGDQEYE